MKGYIKALIILTGILGINGCDDNTPTIIELDNAYQETINESMVGIIRIDSVNYGKSWQKEGRYYFQIKGELILGEDLYYFDPIMDGAFNMKGKGSVTIVTPVTHKGMKQAYQAVVEVNKTSGSPKIRFISQQPAYPVGEFNIFKGMRYRKGFVIRGTDEFQQLIKEKKEEAEAIKKDGNDHIDQGNKMYPVIKNLKDKLNYFWGVGKNNKPISFNEYLTRLRIKGCNKNCTLNKIEKRATEFATLKEALNHQEETRRWHYEAGISAVKEAEKRLMIISTWTSCEDVKYGQLNKPIYSNVKMKCFE